VALSIAPSSWEFHANETQLELSKIVGATIQWNVALRIRMPYDLSHTLIPMPYNLPHTLTPIAPYDLPDTLGMFLLLSHM